MSTDEHLDSLTLQWANGELSVREAVAAAYELGFDYIGVVELENKQDRWHLS